MKTSVVAIGSVVIVAIMLIAAILAGGNAGFSKPQGTLTVTASFYPLAFFAQQIGGGKADVFNITPAGAEPHDYEPTAQDIAQIESSDIVILNGGNLEAWGPNIEKNISAYQAFVVAGEGLTTDTITENSKEIVDPHVWLSPPLAEQMVDKIATAFEHADPADASYFSANAATLKNKLGALDDQYKAGLSHCAQQDFVTSHAAFGYLAKTYGLTQISIAGLSPDTEPSPQQLARLAAFVRANNIHTIFFESLVTPKLADTLAQETGAQTLVLDPIEGITPSDLAQGENYFTKMQQNLHNLEAVLQCS